MTPLCRGRYDAKCLSLLIGKGGGKQETHRGHREQMCGARDEREEEIDLAANPGTGPFLAAREWTLDELSLIVRPFSLKSGSAKERGKNGEEEPIQPS